ncbi:MAG: SCO family protein [Solirubrobacterales bacterium]|nr:SCO family protein [Solirubrobacterales bacterium]
MARVRLTIVVAALLLVTAAAGVAAFRAGEEIVAPAFEGATSPAGVPPSDLRGLRDQEGRAVSLADVRGRVTIVSFLYTSCTDTCPLTAQQIRIALDALGQDVPALAISVDPAGDTSRRAARFLRRQGLEGRMRFLLGDRPALARQWRAYGVQPQGEDFEHSARVVLLDRRGTQRVVHPVDRLDPDALAHDIRALQAEKA